MATAATVAAASEIIVITRMLFHASTAVLPRSRPARWLDAPRSRHDKRRAADLSSLARFGRKQAEQAHAPGPMRYRSRTDFPASSTLVGAFITRAGENQESSWPGWGEEMKTKLQLS
ncbi:hypothetical protein B0T14DRAFT_336140 [Immersiella caudata]|uniref:Uncharacterized protein n=1 Tax=Immersiella caudata TaxID=314043 RepID=A0AA39TLM2_9PEZI|nr:hypothetical protein B0T14DRAFT_336140 [Immersiella caudata]